MRQLRVGRKDLENAVAVHSVFPPHDILPEYVGRASRRRPIPDLHFRLGLVRGAKG